MVLCRLASIAAAIYDASLSFCVGLQGKWASARKRLGAHWNKAEGNIRKYVSAFPMRAKGAVLKAQAVLRSEFAALAESQANAYVSLQSGVDHINTDFRTVTGVPLEYWNLRRTLDTVTGAERDKVLAELHQLELQALGAARGIVVYCCEIFLAFFMIFGIRYSIQLNYKPESPVKRR